MNEINKKLNFSPLFIGSGRLYSHLIYYYRLLFSDSDFLARHTLNEVPEMFSWNRSQGSIDDLKFLVEKASHIFLCISDSEILSFYNQRILPLLNNDLSGTSNLESQGGKVVVHFSGSMVFPGLLKGAHPLMTFSADEMYSLGFYRKIHFVVSEGEHLETLLPFLPNTFSEISPAMKPYYHTLCVLGGNFTMILLRKMLDEMSELNIPKEAVRTYVEKVVENSLLPNKNYLTGPLARKDDQTILKNLKTLEGCPFEDVYLAFIKVVYPEFQGVR